MLDRRDSGTEPPWLALHDDIAATTSALTRRKTNVGRRTRTRTHRLLGRRVPRVVDRLGGQVGRAIIAAHHAIAAHQNLADFAMRHRCAAVGIDNPHFDKKNGVSLLAAARFVDRECVLTMSDHLYSPELVRRLLAADVPVSANSATVTVPANTTFTLTRDGRKVRELLRASERAECGIARAPLSSGGARDERYGCNQQSGSDSHD